MANHTGSSGRTNVSTLRKLTLVGLCVAALQFQLMAASSQMITLSITKGTISDVFKAIESQSDYKFFYNNSQVDLNDQVNVNVSEGSIESVLDNVFTGTNITYKIVNNHVVLTNRTLKEAEVTIVNQQGKRVIGQVLDPNGEPLIGVNVLVKGTTIGTTTDMDGNYVLDGVPANATLEFSYIGYNVQSVNTGNRTSINVTLSEDTQKLDEVVVVGYGSFKKSDLTGAISQVKGDEISALPLRSASDALQGKVAGVTITANSGSPGALGDVRVRGVGTLSQYGNNPLYVVDGMPQDGIGWLNPRDIENIEVLKDASAQAIYGSRAANGVILITTKRGSSGDSYRSNIEFDMSVGFQAASKTYDMLDAEGFMEYKNRAYAAAGRELMEDFATPEKREAILSFLEKNGGRQGTNWWDAITNKPKDAVNQNYNLALSGGTNKLRYRASFGYMNHKGLVKSSEYERLNGRLSVDSEVTKWFNLSANVNVAYEARKNITENDSYTATVFSTASADPITPIYRDNLVDVPDFLYDRIYNSYEPANPWSRYTGVLYSNKPNTVAQVDRHALNVWHEISTKSNITGEFKLFPFLTYKSSISIDLIRAQSDGFTPKYYLDGDEYSSFATASRSAYNTDYWVFDNYLTYAEKFDKHNVSVMVGTSAEKKKYEEFAASKQGMINNDPGQQIINAGTMNPGASGYYVINTLNSYFGRAFYSFDNRYMITANIRWDGSSRFADGNRWGVFPSVSGGWNFSEEKFLESTKSWLSQGKLRVGWGEIGNQTIGDGAYLNTFGNGSYFLFGNGNTQLSGKRNQVGNPDLKWETTRQLDLGLDLAFLQGSLRFTFDYFNRDTRDMLVQVPNPTSLGFPNTPWVNAGSISNKGFEVSVGYDGKAGKDFVYHINANVSTYKNKVKDLGSDASIPGTGVHLQYYTYTMTEVGKPIGYYYGYKTDGVFQTQEEIDSYVNNGQVVMPGAKPGDLKFVDQNKDGKLDDLDRTMVGNPHPDFTFGITLGAEYKGFDFSAFFQGSVGNDLLNILKYDLYGGVGWYNAPKDILTTFWNGPGSTNKNFAIDADSRLNREMSDWFVEDGSYVRLKNLQIGYTIPSSITRKITLNNLRVFVAAQNLFTITGYSGLDPEIGEFNQNPIYRGVDMGYYPQARTFMFGISMKL
ncbi:TonB-dependent receptor [Parabacteroides bouchesdurhonensis]|uniref:TonB-dependent receptor n=1 Tax=Parabacteroides bouchesdurhonensis TaxID=1936995 RepID=UPI001D0CD2BE|nr:TonB-dependent receptor [Parabacteroides bouchesdurhonensis]